MIDIFFIAFGILAISGAITMITVKEPMYATLGLLISILSVGGLFALLNASFLFMVQIIVYAGAVLTLFLFLLMFLNIKKEDLPDEPKKYLLITLGAVFMIPINLLIFKALSDLPNIKMELVDSDFGTIKALGMQLYTKWLLPFELISILLLVALIGVIVLVKQKSKKEIKR